MLGRNEVQEVIVVKVELHSAIDGRVTELARSVIHNIGNGTNPNIGDYQAFACRGRDADTLDKSMMAILRGEAKPVHEGQVLHHPRLAQHVLNLVAKALTAMGYGK